MRNKVHEYLQGKLGAGEKLHFTLIDPDKVEDIEELEKLADFLRGAGTDAFLIGGSSGVTPEEAGAAARALKKTGLPVIIFPGNINCLTREADAVLFMTLMNTLEPYYLVQVQVIAAPIIRKYGLEALPTGYLVINQDTAVAHVGRIYPIPHHKPELSLGYAMAAEMMGMKYFYLEAGSGSQSPVPPSFPALIKKHTSLTVIVGGGIRSPEVAAELARAGADIIVTGTLVERDPARVAEIIRAIKSA